jgi:pimeloyl-ACP methyl ester carboxylesterase
MTHLFETPVSIGRAAPRHLEVRVLVERMAVESEGEGEPVLMVHGLGGTSNTFTPVLGAFARHRTIRFDLPGSGRSHRVEGPLSLALFVDRARLVMVRTGVERAHLVAHSMGTIVATHLAASEPGRVASLALFGPLLAPSEAARAAIRVRAAQARAGDMQPIADALVRASLSAETRARRPAAVAFVRESLMRQDPEGYARSCEALAEMGPADTSRIACPTLLVTGDEDVVAPPQAVRMMGERIAGSRVEVLRGCGHWTPVEKPEECTGLLQRFLLERRPTWRTSSSRTFGSSTPPGPSPTRARS